MRADRSLTVNLGTGRGVSVLELLRGFEKASGRPVPYEIVARRPGDVAEVYADPALAREAAHDAAQVAGVQQASATDTPESEAPLT